MSAKVLLLDIETAPSLGWVWGKWEQNVIDFKQDWYILSFAYKWLGEREVHCVALPDFHGYAKERENDRALVQRLWQLMDEAEVIVAHNGDGFDIKKSNSRFISHGLPPPSPYRTVDTLKVAKRYFRFDSNKLDELGRYLGIGRKLATTGFVLWQGCMKGDVRSWARMKQYNKQDITLLEKVYLLMRGWATTHPNVNHGLMACPKCNSRHIQKRGFSYTLHNRKQRYQCIKCHGWFEGRAEKVDS